MRTSPVSADHVQKVPASAGLSRPARPGSGTSHRPALMKPRRLYDSLPPAVSSVASPGSAARLASIPAAAHRLSCQRAARPFSSRRRPNRGRRPQPAPSLCPVITAPPGPCSWSRGAGGTEDLPSPRRPPLSHAGWSVQQLTTAAPRRAAPPVATSGRRAAQQPEQKQCGDSATGRSEFRERSARQIR